MLWDRVFGTFQREEERPVYGLTRQIDTVNPIKVWFHEVPGLYRDLVRSASLSDLWGYLFRPPGWQPRTADT